MNSYVYGRKAVTVFFLIALVMSAAAEIAIGLGGPDWLYLILMWMPAAGAFAAGCVAVRERGNRLSVKALLSVTGFRRCKFRYILAGVLIPFVYLLIPYGIFWLTHPGSFVTRATSWTGAAIGILIQMVLGTLISLLSALGEEIGWRGFLVPSLYERLGPKKTLALSSAIWCLWHFPLLIFGDYMPGTPLWYQLPAFFLCIFPVGIIAGLLAIRSGSLWPAAFLHAAHNNYDQAIFGVLTVSDQKMYFVSETGVLTILCAWAIAILLYRAEKKRSSLH